MKKITVAELQKKLSKITKNVENGEVYEVNRYTKPIAYLVPTEKFKDVVTGESCKACMEDVREIAKGFKGKDDK